MDITREFFFTLIFVGAKRPFTKKRLARLNLKELASRTSFKEINDFYEEKLSAVLKYNISENDYLNYLNFYKTKA